MIIKDKQLVLQPISQAERNEKLLVKCWYPFLMDRPVQNATWM